MNEYHKERNEEIIMKAKEEPTEKLSIETVTVQFDRIKQSRIDKNKLQ